MLIKLKSDRSCSKSLKSCKPRLLAWNIELSSPKMHSFIHKTHQPTSLSTFPRKTLIFGQHQFRAQEINTLEPAESILRHCQVPRRQKKNKTPITLRIRKKSRNKKLTSRLQLKKIGIKRVNLEKLWSFDLSISFLSLSPHQSLN